jgi:hypothetical protein
LSLTSSRKTILAVALCVLVARVTGLHLHLCPHEEGPQSELHTFTHADLGCEQTNDSEPEPADVELDTDGNRLVKSLKLGLDLPAVACSVAGVVAEPVTDRIHVVAQISTNDSGRALRPPLRGPPV